MLRRLLGWALICDRAPIPRFAVCAGNSSAFGLASATGGGIPGEEVHDLDENAINVFTDGSVKERPRRGGVGYRIVTVDEQGEEVTWDSDLPGYPGASNNEMELQPAFWPSST